MSDLSDETLKQIIAADESDRVEFKESLSGSAAIIIREATCAFANDLARHPEPEFDVTNHFVRVTMKARETAS